MDCDISKAWRPPRPDLTVGLETIFDHIPLGLVLEEVTEELFLLRLVLAGAPRSCQGLPPRSEGRGELTPPRTLTPLRRVTALRSDSPGRSRSPSPLRESPALRSPPLLL